MSSDRVSFSSGRGAGFLGSLEEFAEHMPSLLICIVQMESSAQYQIPEAGEEDVSDDEGHVSVSRC